MSSSCLTSSATCCSSAAICPCAASSWPFHFCASSSAACAVEPDCRCSAGMQGLVGRSESSYSSHPPYKAASCAFECHFQDSCNAVCFSALARHAFAQKARCLMLLPSEMLKRCCHASCHFGQHSTAYLCRSERLQVLQSVLCPCVRLFPLQ